MSDTRLPTADMPLTRQAIAIEGRSGRGKVTGKLRTALDAMVWSGSRRADAARAAGLADHSLRCALTKPHVKAYYREQLEVLRESEKARNILRLTEIRDAANNMPAVNAIKALEQIDDAQSGLSRSSTNTPGLVIVIGQRTPATAGDIGHDTVIDAKQLKSFSSVDRER